MKSEWATMKASGFIEFNPRLSLKKGTLATKIAMDKLQPFTKRIDITEKALYSGGAKFCNGDTILARITPCLENGKTAFVDILQEGEVGFGSTEFIVMRAKKGVSDPQFVYYVATSPFFRERAIKSMVGSSGRQRVQQSVIENLELSVPPLQIQKKIGSFLSEIDKKIAVNNQINDNLLDQMQALYKSWFVDFLPFDGVRPESWTKTDIYSLANIIYGAPFASKQFNAAGEGKPIIRIRDLKDQQFATYTTEVHPKGYLLQPGDIVVGMDGEFRPYIWGNDEAWLNQRVCVFENKRPNGKAFLYFTIKPLLYSIEQTQVATTVIHIGKKDYDAFEITLPDTTTLDNFDALTSPMIMQIVSNSFENKRLSSMRDALLPKLMSGEIDVSSIQL
jgi:type I restriction enzyme S subunit